MQLVTLTFNAPLNAGIQVGDFIYYSPLTTVPLSGQQTAVTNTTVLLGVAQSILNPLGIGNLFFDPITISVLYDELQVTAPAQGDYISFEKDKRVNSSGLLGYYASVEFVNFSDDKVELFQIGSEVSESSK
tara:strand:- start:647 stop:1039 length:393 start_codon:yes stop_codon:yes gene_type:complete